MKVWSLGSGFNLFFLLLVSLVVHFSSASLQTECSDNADCDLFPYQTCQKQSDMQEEGTCTHKTAFPLYLGEVIGTGAITIGLGMCNAGGVGGGTLLTPLLILFGKFKQTEAVALANFAILIAGFIRFIQHLDERHPQASHKLSIDYNLVLILMPMTLLGTTLGVLINTTFPDAAILLIMTIVFLTASIITLKKGIQKCKKEIASRMALQKVESSRSSSNSLEKKNGKKKNKKSMSSNKSIESPTNKRGMKEAGQNDLNSSRKLREDDEVPSSLPSGKVDKNYVQMQRQGIEQEDVNQSQIKMQSVKPLKESHCVWYKTALIWFMLSSLVGVSLLRKGFGFQIEKCSIIDLSLQGTLVLIAIICTILGALIALRDDRFKRENGYKFTRGQFRLSSCKRVFCLSLVILIGTALATAIGSGGGTIYSPLLLSLDLPVEVTRATALYLIMYKSFATVIQFAILEMIDWSYGAWYGVFALIATLFISKSISQCTRNRQSALIIIISQLLIISSILTPYVAITRIVHSGQVKSLGDSILWEFDSLCDG